ncbi:MAG: alpha/beta hydrolase [Actinomycetota bacterium]|nr:alpha/beta hydrolase [Actinomycetota bacterium]
MSGTPTGSPTVVTSSSTSGLAGEDIRVERVRYGNSRWQAGNLRIPPGAGPFPVVVFIHGGFWRAGFNETLMAALAEDAVGRGVVTWNFDYRAVGHPGGGYPGTLEDVAAALDHLTGLDEPLDLEDVIVVGHSAGGHLALWATSRSGLKPGDPGSDPAVVPHTVVAQAAVVDLYAAAGKNLGGGAVQGFLGGNPDEVPDRYRVASPSPTNARVIAVHGRYDLVVPIGQSSRLVGAEGIFDDTGTHFDVLDPAHGLWQRTVEALGLS